MHNASNDLWSSCPTFSIPVPILVDLCDYYLADNPNLVEAWDFEVKGDQPTKSATRTITGLKGHTATLVGDNWQWIESTDITDNK